MHDHLTPHQIEVFSANPATSAIGNVPHIANCEHCHDLMVNNLRKRNKQTVRFTLDDNVTDSHLEYEQLLEFPELTQADENFQILNSHIESCSRCQEDLFSLLQFRQELRAELNIDYSLDESQLAVATSSNAWWRSSYFGYSLAASILILLAIITSIFVAQRRFSNFTVQQKTVPLVSPNQNAASITTSDSAQESGPAPKLIAELNDRNGRITVDENGELKGLDELSTTMKNAVVETARSQRLSFSPVLKKLKPDRATLRGSNLEGFKVLSPVNTVIVMTSPVFHWQPMQRATRYQVYVLDENGNEIIRSEELGANLTQWAPSRALKRDALYSWVVTALVNGKEIVSPGPGSSEVRFQIISVAAFKELRQLRKTRSHLALGTFYARHGMLDDAEIEFRALLNINPESTIAKQLYQTCREAKRLLRN